MRRNGLYWAWFLVLLQLDRVPSEASSRSHADSQSHPACLESHGPLCRCVNPHVHSKAHADVRTGIGRLFSIVLLLQRNGGFKEWSQAKAKAKAEKRAGRSRRGQGRYRTIDGMESLPRPGAAHDPSGSHFDTSYPMLSTSNGQVYQPPPGSPPSYNDEPAGPRPSYSPPEPNQMLGGRMWDGQRYERSPSPGGRYTGTRDMV